MINSILPRHPADPWVIFHGGFYFYSETREQRRIFLRKSRTIAGLCADPGVCVWTAPVRGDNSQNLWAPELHLIDGRWFIYYAADDGRHENRRMWVLESQSSDPCGRYRCCGRLDTGGWAIDGTVLALGDGRRYFVWSGRSNRRSRQQNIYISAMRHPAALSGTRVLISSPDQPWERVAMPVCEGPQVLRRNGDIFIVYSASGSSSPDSCLGLLHNKTSNVLDPANWLKYGPVLKRTSQIWGMGHCSFVKSLSQTEEWLIYHPESGSLQDRQARAVHAQRFNWASDGFPDFEAPAPRVSTVLSLPAANDRKGAGRQTEAHTDNHQDSDSHRVRA